MELVHQTHLFALLIHAVNPNKDAYHYYSQHFVHKYVRLLLHHDSQTPHFFTLLLEVATTTRATSTTVPVTRLGNGFSLNEIVL